MTKALALLSGGLDSTLAIHVIKKQGIDVIALNFVTVFCLCTSKGNCKLEAVKVSETIGIPIKVINTTHSFLEIVKKPKHGYGKNMNPCIDCRINIFRAAGKYMREIGASFIITGEVLGQRPMSQRKEAMKTIDREAGLTGLVLRPLCAKHLEPTIPEKTGLVNREELLQIKGRSRKDQIQLADIFQIKDYPCSSGGCILTDPEFANRMRDSLKYGNPDINDVKLLKVGRHFRIDSNTKVIVGRKEDENLTLQNLAKDNDYLLHLKDFPGPLALIRGDIDDEKLKIAAQLTARSSKAKSLPNVTVIISKKQGLTQNVINVPQLDPDKAIALMIKNDYRRTFRYLPGK
ncbi:MAG: thiamin biosynthesis protein [Candidatus Scalindua rubra]|uniref:Thiamin biosynthesis protein n=1 Tax=Candidatus Scalindua rubra TaxID=1872076 RepID=A0A1E3X9F0_9BACT|nr:MAG: thiamin biosynthesis protein [Candidatus Scalindua rubra]